MQKFACTIFIQIIFLLFTFQHLSAQESTRKKFAINEHEFLSTSSVESANIETSLFTRLSVGSTGLLTSKGIIIDDKEILSFTGSLLYAGANVGYKQKVNDWFAFYLNVMFLGRVGTQIPTILAEGINTASSTDFGWIFKMYQHQNGYLSGTVFSNRHTGSIVDFSRLVEDIVDGDPEAKLINVVPVSIIGARLQYAHAFSKIWGAQFDFSYAYGETLYKTSKKSNIDLGIFVDTNLYAEKNIPIGFGLGYNLTSMPEVISANEKLSNVFFFNLAYTKASDFELGLEVMYHKVPISNYTTTPYLISPSLLLKFRF